MLWRFERPKAFLDISLHLTYKVGPKVGPKRFGGDIEMAARTLNKLTAIQAAKLTTPGRHSDGGGLYLFIDDAKRALDLHVYPARKACRAWPWRRARHVARGRPD